MKKLTLLLALGIGMISLCSAQVGETTVKTKPTGYMMSINAKEFGLTLAYKHNISEIRSMVNAYRLPDSIYNDDAVMEKLDNIELWIKGLIPKIKGLRIDVIGQTHVGGPMEDPTYQTILLESQSMVKNILLANQYDIVGDEGNALPVVTKKDILDGNNGSKAIVDGKASADEIASYYATYGLTRSAVSSLLLLPPGSGFNSKVIGIEDDVIWNLHSKVLGQKIYASLDDKATILRSYIAFFKVAEAMLKTKAKSGVVVMGLMHLKDFAWIARSSGTLTDFYFASNSNDFFRYMSEKEDF